MGRTGIVALVVAALLTCAACDRGAPDNRAAGTSPGAPESPEASPTADAAAPASPTPAASSPAPAPGPVKAAASPGPSPTAAASPKPAASYNMSCGTLTVGPGTTGSAPCTVTAAGAFTGKVALACSTGPGMTCGIAPNEVAVGPDAPATATLTLAVDAAHPGGTSDLTIRAGAGSSARVATVAVPVPTFTFTCPSGATGGVTNCELVSVGGFSGTVGVSCTGEWGCTPSAGSYVLRSGATVPAPLSFTAPPDPQPGKPYSLTATAAAGAVTRTATFQMSKAS